MKRIILLIAVLIVSVTPLSALQEVDYHKLAGAFDAEIFSLDAVYSEDLADKYNQLLIYEEAFPNADVYTVGLKVKYNSLLNED